METVKYKNAKLNLVVGDIGNAQEKIMLKRHYNSIQAIIFIVDSTDSNTIDSACEELKLLMEDEALQSAHVLVLANKQDIQYSMNVGAVTTRLQLSKFAQRQWYVQSSILTRGSGLDDGMNWLVAVTTKK